MLLNAKYGFVKVVNEQYLFKLLLRPLQYFSLHDASARAQKYFQVLDLGLNFFFLEVTISTLNHQNLTPS